MIKSFFIKLLLFCLIAHNAFAQISSVESISPLDGVVTSKTNPNKSGLISEFILSVLLGSWGADCGKAKFVSKFDSSSNQISQETFFNDKLAFISYISVASIELIEKKDGIYLFKYLVESKQISSDIQRKSTTFIQTDLISFRKIIYSENLVSGDILVRDGINISNNNPTPLIKRCK